MATRLNFTVLSTFNIVIVGSVRRAVEVEQYLKNRGATTTQMGFILNSGKEKSKKKGMPAIII